MDVDLDLECTDRISDFLRTKLQAVKSENAELESALLHRREAADTLCRNLTTDSDHRLTFISVWKKTVNGSYVLGVELKNDSSCALTNVVVTVAWTSSIPLSYKSHILSSDSLKPISSITDRAHIVITFDIPIFADHLSYTTSCLFTFQQNDKKIKVKLPSSLQLTPEDTTDSTVTVDLHKVINGSPEDFLATVTTGEKYEFVVRVPQTSRRLIENALEADCALHRISLKSEEKFFLVYKISPGLDGTVLELFSSDGKEQLNIYSKNFDTMVALLHYLHTRINGILTIPKPLYRPDLSLVELTDLVKTSLLKELDSLEETSGDLKDLRTKMLNLEHETDTLVARINETRQTQT